MSDTAKTEGGAEEVRTANPRLRAVAAARQEPDAADRGAARRGHPAPAGPGRSAGRHQGSRHRAVLPGHERRRWRAVRQPGPALRRRRRHRIRQEGRRLDGAGRRRRLPGGATGVQDHVAHRAGRTRSTKSGEQAQINYGVFAGIVVGLVAALLFDRYHTIQLPSYLGFFGGRRFVPIVVSLACLFLALRHELLLSDLQRGPESPRRVHRRQRERSAHSFMASSTAC